MQSFEEPQCTLPVDYHMGLPTLSYAYGAAHAAARYCGYDRPPHPPRGQWQHGWVRPECNCDPAYVIWDDGQARKDIYHFLARKDQEIFLRIYGYENAYAIGNGPVYLPPINIPRLKNSLLVMPAHSLYTTKHEWNFKRYVDEISEIRDEFDCVAACVHPACLQKGYWVDAFKDANIEIITGALFPGRHALERLQWMMSRFEYMTTNISGTQVAYAAYWGAKVSTYGTFIEMDEKDYANVGLFEALPHLMEPHVRYCTEAWSREFNGFLFCHPKEAQELRDWGAWQVGQDDKRSPEQLRDLFCWPSPNPLIQVSQDVDDSVEAILANARNDILSDKTANEVFFPLQNLARKGVAEAQYFLGIIYYFGFYYECEDTEEALRWFRLAADNDHAEACLFVAALLTHPDRPISDQADGAGYVARAAEMGLGEAKAFLD